MTIVTPPTPTLLVQPSDSLTSWEWRALRGQWNIADGHAHQALTTQERAIVTRLPQLFDRAAQLHQDEAQAVFLDAFRKAAGQEHWRQLAPPLYHYSSSVSIEVVANMARLQHLTVGLISPTFDNIPAILRRHHVQLVSLPEQQLQMPAETWQSSKIDILFLVAPNNPTGWEPTREEFEALATYCASRGIILAIDFSFRFFGGLTAWDQYAILDAAGCPFIGIEDTGKTWPSLDLKLGCIFASPQVRPMLEQTTNDILLNVSPLIYLILAEFATQLPVMPLDLAPGGVARRHREELVSATTGTGITVETSNHHMSVAWCRLPDDVDGISLCDWLANHNVVVLPGTPFHWSDPALGRHYIRVALLRPDDYFTSAVDAFTRGFHGYRTRLRQG